MITLKKMRLINWHYFINVTVDIEQITFLTGANGTGKSTIIDALQTVLTGDTAGRNFNKAASEKTGRTLRGYLRGETGETDKGEVICLRPGRFTSYVALEFLEGEGKSFTLGIYFDCFDNESETHQFFYINDSFPEHNFTNADLLEEGKRPLTGKELIQYCRTTYKESDFRFFESNISYQQFIKGRFGNLPDKYFTLFKKAVGFTPISNIAQFITEFVCDIDYHVNIAPMQSNIEQYKLLENQAKEMQVRLEKLEKIEEAFKEFSKIKNDIVLSEYIVDRANYEVAKATLDDSVNALMNAKREIESSKEQIQEAELSLSELKDEKEQYQLKKLGNSSFSLANELSNKKTELQNKITSLTLSYENNMAKVKDYINSYETSARNFVNSFNNYDLSFATSGLQDSLSHLLDTSEEITGEAGVLKAAIDDKTVSPVLLRNFQELMTSYNQEAHRFSNDLERDIYNRQKVIDEYNADVNEMKKGNKPFQSRYIELKNSLTTALKERHSDAIIETYCDLIDIDDKIWTRAIEAILNNTKFNFFVNEEYYEEANTILSRLAERMNMYHISLVDSARLIERDFKKKPGSLAEVVSTEDEGARAYTNYLLGNIKRCRTFEEARNSGNGMMPDCVGYHNFATWYLNKARSEGNFIGTAVSGEHILSRKEEIDELNRGFSRLVAINNYLTGVFRLELMSTKECESYISIIEQQKEIASLESHVSRYQDELSEGDNIEVSKIDSKIQAIEEDMTEITAEKDNLLTRIGELKNECRSLEENLIPNQKQSLELYQTKLASFDPEFVESECLPYFENAVRSLSLTRIREEANRNFAQKQSKLRGAKDSLFTLRSRYVSERHLNYDCSNETSNSEFDQELHSLREVELPSYREKIIAAHDKAVKEFKDDFIYKLRTSIENVKAQIDDLNVAIHDVKFGRDSYRFSVTPNRDYQEYYDMITDELLLNVGDTEDLFFKKYSTLIENLINLITSANLSGNNAEQKAQILQNIDKFTDYRTYLVFDLKVKSSATDVESSLSRTFKRKSGGETQTPFYISILASFAQLYRVNKPNNDQTLRLVIFDEAFSKMDAARIIESVALLRTFGLQVILSTPSEKVRDLAKEVDLTLVVHHRDKEKLSYIDRHEDRRQLQKA